MEAGGHPRRFGALLLADDEEHPVLDQDPQAVGGDARDVDDDLHGVLGLEDIQGRRTLSRHVGPALRRRLAEVLEQPAYSSEIGRVVSDTR